MEGIEGASNPGWLEQTLRLRIVEMIERDPQAARLLQAIWRRCGAASRITLVLEAAAGMPTHQAAPKLTNADRLWLESMHIIPSLKVSLENSREAE